MTNYNYSIIVKKEHLDILNHVNNVVYIQWAQDIAQKHWDLAITDDIKQNYFWVLLNHTIDYKKPAVLNDEIEIKTFILKSGGVKSKRCVEFYLKSSQILLARSETTWCLFNTKSQKPHRITDTITNCFN